MSKDVSRQALHSFCTLHMSEYSPPLWRNQHLHNDPATEKERQSTLSTGWFKINLTLFKTHILQIYWAIYN